MLLEVVFVKFFDCDLHFRLRTLQLFVFFMLCFVAHHALYCRPNMHVYAHRPVGRRRTAIERRRCAACRTIASQLVSKKLAHDGIILIRRFMKTQV